MKRKILTVATVLTMGLIGHSQCDVKVNIDSYTQKKTIETGFIDFEQGSFKIHKEGLKISMYLSLNTPTSVDIRNGEILYFKLANSKIVKLINTSIDYSSYSIYTGYGNSFYFDFNIETLKAFQSSPIVGIKCYINEYEIPTKIGEQLQNNFKCITEIK